MKRLAMTAITATLVMSMGAAAFATDTTIDTMRDNGMKVEKSAGMGEKKTEREAKIEAAAEEAEMTVEEYLAAQEVKREAKKDEMTEKMEKPEGVERMEKMERPEGMEGSKGQMQGKSMGRK